MKPVVERFIKYTAYDTQSKFFKEGETAAYPSTDKQKVFARALADECKNIGLSDVLMDEYGYVTATLPANIPNAGGSDIPVIGFLAHMDTSPDASGANVKPRIVKNYDGGVIELNAERSLSPDEFEKLRDYTGQDIIVTDGNTLLGADDKAGAAEIMTAMEYLLAHPEIRHGTVRVGFTPDEEVGAGVDYFDVKAFGADFAYTVDGGEVGELEHENFNAARVAFNITGKSVHPGASYGVMVNAALVAAELVSRFPEAERPATTKERDGFYHLTHLSGDVGAAAVEFILRDFDAEGLERRKRFAQAAAGEINAKYGAGAVTLKIRDEYRNMAEALAGKPEIMERAFKAMTKAGITPIEKPIRGGTDGSRLSFMGLPCPNIFTGGHNAHGPYEYIPVPSMEAAVRVIINLCEL